MREKLMQLTAFLFGTTEPPARIVEIEHVHLQRHRSTPRVELEECA